MKRGFEIFIVWGPDAARSSKTSSSGPAGLCLGDIPDKEGIVSIGVGRLAPGFGIDVDVRWALFWSVKCTKTVLATVSSFALTTCDYARRIPGRKEKSFSTEVAAPSQPGRGEMVPIQYQELLDNVR